MITLVGLGPADSAGLSVAARRALRAATRLILRTEQHPAADDLRRDLIPFESLDSAYDAAQSFDTLYAELASCVMRFAEEGDVTYAVPGHPLCGEESVRLVMERARAVGIPFQVIGSSSFIEASLDALGRSLGDGLLVLDALSLANVHPRPDLDVLIYQVYDAQVASDTKLALMRQYPDDHPVDVITAAGVPAEQTVTRIPLHRLDRVAVSHLTSVYVPALPPDQRRRSFGDLVDVMARLRGEGGCPWDREQDHATLKRYLIEECYEAIEAIDQGDMDELAEELGDVLLQVVFHAQLEAEAGVFDIDDVIARIVDKLIRRHPHVFGDTVVAGTEDVLRNWERIKRAEKAPGWRESALDGVPSGMPALMRAAEISKRAVKVGFEWEKFEDVLAKLHEEVRELEEALAGQNRDEIAAEIGDLLFTIVNIARWQEVDAEDALRTMLNRFAARFRDMEAAARSQERNLSELTPQELDALWVDAKLRRIGSGPTG